MSAGLSTEMFGTAETHNPNRRITFEKAHEIIEDCNAMGVKAIQFTGGGEPTVHQNWETLIRFAQALFIDTALVTNGVNLRPKSPAIYGLSWLRVSIDAGDPVTYAKLRRAPESQWTTAWKNIETIARVFAGTLGIGYVVTPENYTGIAACARLARDAGADNIRIGAVFSKEGLAFYGDGVRAILDHIQLAKEIETPTFKVMDLFGRRFSDLEGGSPKHPFCGYQYFTTYIGADLNVYRCCNTSYTKHGLLGSLKTTRFRDLKPAWALDARTCTFCQFQGQNETINSALEKPEHGNFV